MSHAICSLPCTNKTAMNQDAVAFVKIPLTAETNYSLERMQFYMSLASQFLNELLRINIPVSKAGTTFTACLVKPGAYYLTAHVGDSRAYSASKLASGWWVRQLTFDHDRAHDLRPEIKWSSTRPERLKNTGLNMSRAMGNWDSEDSGLSHDADVSGSHYKEGETVFFVCSDGLSDALTSDDIEKYLNEHRPIHEAPPAASSGSVSHTHESAWEKIVHDLTQKAKQVWLKRSDHSDDISISIVDISTKLLAASALNEAELLLVADGHGTGGELFAQHAVKFFPIILHLLLQHPYERIPHFSSTDFGLKLYQYFESLPKNCLDFNNPSFEENLNRLVLPFIELLIKQEWLSGTEDELKLNLARLNNIAAGLNEAGLNLVLQTLMQTYVKNNFYFIDAFAKSTDVCNIFNKDFYGAASYFYAGLVKSTTSVPYDYELITQLQLWLMFEIVDNNHVMLNRKSISAPVLARVAHIFNSNFDLEAVNIKLRPLYQRAVLYHHILELLECRRFNGFREDLLREWQTELVSSYPVSKSVLFENYQAHLLFSVPMLSNLLIFLLSPDVDGLLSMPIASYKDFDIALDGLLKEKFTDYRSLEEGAAAQLRREIIQFRKWLLLKDFFNNWHEDEESNLDSEFVKALNNIYKRKIRVFNNAIVDKLIDIISSTVKELPTAKNLFSIYVLDLSLPDEPKTSTDTASTSTLWLGDISSSADSSEDDYPHEESCADSDSSGISAAGGAGR